MKKYYLFSTLILIFLTVVPIRALAETEESDAEEQSSQAINNESDSQPAPDVNDSNEPAPVIAPTQETAPAPLPATKVAPPVPAKQPAAVQKNNNKTAGTVNTSKPAPVKAAPAPAYSATAYATEPNPAPDKAATAGITTIALVPHTFNPTQIQKRLTDFPWAWVTTRAAATVSFIMLALLTMTGISLSTGLLYRIFSPATGWSVHRAIGSILLISVLVHIFSLLFDQFIGMNLLDILVPFASSYQPLLVSLGIVGFYLLALILGTSFYKMATKAKFWRRIHYLSFPMFALIFIHSILLGTDSHQPLMQALYWGSAVLVMGFVIYRIAWKFYRPATDYSYQKRETIFG
ncbi:MAG: hypothetical protein WCV50_06195 [Patescibacteria group bacterium]|jgi:hypothetical protein